ncbi:MAG: hypothetical protein K9N51_06145, partial [Candidatus Pacebacteria bacterium]|nr:hypothetical protein [Candidatus Paceibacterota bacterium]
YKNAKAAFAAGAHMLKINTRELTEVTGENDISTAAHCIFSDYPIEIVGVTAGSEAAYLFTRNHAWRFDIPAMGTVQNPLGAGDTMTAVLVARLTEEKAKQQNIKKADFAGSFADNLANVFREALATATASCITRDPARFSPDKVRELIPSITVNEL